MNVANVIHADHTIIVSIRANVDFSRQGLRKLLARGFNLRNRIFFKAYNSANVSDVEGLKLILNNDCELLKKLGCRIRVSRV